MSEDAGDLVVGEDRDHRRGELGASQAREHVVLGELLFVQPGREGLEDSHVAVDGEGRQPPLLFEHQRVIPPAAGAALELGHEVPRGIQGHLPQGRALAELRPEPVQEPAIQRDGLGATPLGLFGRGEEIDQVGYRDLHLVPPEGVRRSWLHFRTSWVVVRGEFQAGKWPARAVVGRAL